MRRALLTSIAGTGLLVFCGAAARFLPEPTPAYLPRPDSGGHPPVNSIETIIRDMQWPHAGHPHGVPRSYNWALKPGIGMGNDPRTFSCMTAWGQLYEDARGNPATNTRVSIRNMRAFVLSRRDRRWHLIQTAPRVAGAAFAETFAGNRHRPADIRAEADQSVSVKAGGGFNFHFWPAAQRAPIDRKDIAGIFVTVQARLVADNPDLPDDRDQARYLLCAGGDYWRNRKAAWFFWKTNHAIAMGRFKYVENEWQAFNMATLSEPELRQNPPPLE